MRVLVSVLLTASFGCLTADSGCAQCRGGAQRPMASPRGNFGQPTGIAQSGISPLLLAQQAALPRQMQFAMLHRQAALQVESGAIAGTVTDAETGAPIPNVSIRVYIDASSYFSAGVTSRSSKVRYRSAIEFQSDNTNRGYSNHAGK